ncbi:hypothetical protein QYM36_000240, partial [Artemia franciscana]
NVFVIARMSYAQQKQGLMTRARKIIHDPTTGDKCHLYSSGSSDGSGLHEVGFLLQKKAEPAVLEWESIPNCIALIRMLGHSYQYNNHNCLRTYSPDRQERCFFRPDAEFNPYLPKTRSATIGPHHMASVKDVRRRQLSSTKHDRMIKNVQREDDSVAFSRKEIVAAIEYTDGGTPIVDFVQKAQNMIESVANTARETGLAISIPKTKCLSTKYNASAYLSREPIKGVEEFKYLGSWIYAKDVATSEVQGWISKAWSANDTSDHSTPSRITFKRDESRDRISFGNSVYDDIGDDDL